MKVSLRQIHPFRIIVLLLCMVMIFTAAKCPYQKMKPVADADKPTLAGNNSCWLATAANMLAGAGYGDGNTIQARADDIYGELTDPDNFGTADRGWPQTALQWWRDSTYNTWTNNPYTVVSVSGTLSMNPWDDENIPRIIGNELRRCQFIGLCFSWPIAGPTVGSGGHATTGWGDNFSKGTLSINPTQIRMADSDRDAGGDIQVYTYDAYDNPNPGGPNEGDGCYFDFSIPHPYIRCIVTLCPTDDPSDNRQTQIVVGSVKIHQGRRINATDLHYKVGTDTRILSYKTEIDWDDDLTPTIVESQPVRTELTVDWDLSDKPVSFCKWVTITTEFVLPAWNAIEYEDVHFTYPELRIVAVRIPDLYWALETPTIEKAHTIEDVTGGYVIGGFEIINPEVEENNGVVAEYRFSHQYDYNQSPEQHKFLLTGQKGFYVTNLRFGHTYGILTTKDLWKFEKWMTKIDENIPLEEKRHEIKIDWEGKLPYPKGIDVRDAIEYIKQGKPKRKR